MEDLVAYVQRLGTGNDPGVTDTAMRVGVVLPPAGLSGHGRSGASRPHRPLRGRQPGRAGSMAGGSSRASSRRRSRRTSGGPGRPISSSARRCSPASPRSSPAPTPRWPRCSRRSRCRWWGRSPSTPRRAFPLNRYVFYLLPGIEAQGGPEPVSPPGRGWPVPQPAGSRGAEDAWRPARPDSVVFSGSGRRPWRSCGRRTASAGIRASSPPAPRRTVPSSPRPPPSTARSSSPSPARGARRQQPRLRALGPLPADASPPSGPPWPPPRCCSRR